MIFHQVSKEIVARNVDTNLRLEQSRAAKLTEVFRTKPHPVKQELTSERRQGKKVRMQLEEKIDNLKTDIHNDKGMCKQFKVEEIMNFVSPPSSWERDEKKWR